MKRILISLILVVLLVGSVSALGVSPARTTLNFEPGLKKTVNFEVFNSEGKDMDLVISVGGELSNYIKVDKKEVKISKNEPSKVLSYELKLPQKLNSGTRTGEIIILESPPKNELGQDSSQVMATLAVITQVYIYVPTPSKAVDAQIVISSEENHVRFALPVYSSGEYDIKSVRAVIDVYNILGNKVGNFSTKEISLKSGQRGELSYDWKGNISDGEYLARVLIIYDGENDNIEQKFTVGKVGMEIEQIKVVGFKLGEIAKFESVVVNHMNKLFSDAFVETKILDKDNRILSSFKSSQEQIDPLSKKLFTYYWDTAGFRVGQYETKLSIMTGNETYNQSVIFDVKENELNVVGLGYVISSDGGSMDSTVLILAIVIFVLVAINILWFLVIRKRLNKK